MYRNILTGKLKIKIRYLGQFLSLFVCLLEYSNSWGTQYPRNVSFTGNYRKRVTKNSYFLLSTHLMWGSGNVLSVPYRVYIFFFGQCSEYCKKSQFLFCVMNEQFLFLLLCLKTLLLINNYEKFCKTFWKLTHYI